MGLAACVSGKTCHSMDLMASSVQSLGSFMFGSLVARSWPQSPLHGQTLERAVNRNAESVSLQAQIFASELFTANIFPCAGIWRAGEVSFARTVRANGPEFNLTAGQAENEKSLYRSCSILQPWLFQQALPHQLNHRPQSSFAQTVPTKGRICKLALLCAG